MIVDVCRAKGEQWTTTAAQQKLRQHEEQDRAEGWRFALEAVVSSAENKKKGNFFRAKTFRLDIDQPQVVVRRQRRIGQLTDVMTEAT